MILLNHKATLGILVMHQVLFTLIRAESLNKEVINQVEAQVGKINCPQRISSGTDDGRSKMFLYSPNDRKDVGITYEGSDWSGDDLKKLIEGGFDLEKPTLIYLHAYIQSYRSKWLKNVRDQFDKMYPRFSDQEPRFNLLFFDWSSFSKQPYSISVSWVPHLAKVMSQFLKKLTDLNYDIKKVQLVSYSMSAHISGLASRQMAPASKVSKILALDPAGPCFHDKNSFINNYALRSTDADLVVTQIYDFNGLGPKKPIGGLDIFVNGGSRQPMNRQVDIKAWQYNGIEEEDDDGSVKRYFYSNHVQATEHATHEFDGTCQQVAYACRSYKAFLRGECGDCGKNNEDCYNIDTMYEFPPNTNYRPNERMFIKTGSTNFCLHHYQVILRMKSNIFSNNRQLVDSGAVSINFGSDFQDIKPRYRSQFSGKFTTLALRSKRLEFIPDQITVNAEAGRASKGLINSIELIELNYMSEMSTQERSKRSARYCNISKSNKFERC